MKPDRPDPTDRTPMNLQPTDHVCMYLILLSS